MRSATDAADLLTVCDQLRDIVIFFLCALKLMKPPSTVCGYAVIPMKSQYVKTTIKAGQTFRILAVFEDDRSRSQKSSSAVGQQQQQTDREKIRGRYVQILSETRQVMMMMVRLSG